MNKFDYPLKLLQGLETLYESIRSIVDNNNEYFKIVNDELFDLHIEASDPKVFFKLLKSALNEKGELYTSIQFFPLNGAQHVNGNYNVYTPQIFEMFNHWMELVKDYEKVAVTRSDKFLKKSEGEFYEELKIVDDAADHEPFTLPQQVFIYKYLEFVEQTLEKEKDAGSDTSEVEEAVTLLKSNLQNLTKNKTLHGISKILAKTKKIGIGLISKVWDEAVKALVKEGVQKVLENPQDMLEKMTKFVMSHGHL